MAELEARGFLYDGKIHKSNRGLLFGKDADTKAILPYIKKVLGYAV